MSGNIGEKARAAFLALIMVTSVMMAGVAFTGSAAALEDPSNEGEFASVVVDGSSAEPGEFQKSVTATVVVAEGSTLINNDTDEIEIDFNSQVFNSSTTAGNVELEIIDNTGTVVRSTNAGTSASLINGSSSDETVGISGIDSEITSYSLSAGDKLRLKLTGNNVDLPSDDITTSIRVATTSSSAEEEVDVDFQVPGPVEVDDGSSTTSYSTISAAESAASDGDTITVGDGLYDNLGNTISVSTANVTIQAASGASPTVIADREAGQQLDITAEGVTVDGLTFDGNFFDTRDAIGAGNVQAGVSAANVTLQNNVVTTNLTSSAGYSADDLNYLIEATSSSDRLTLDDNDITIDSGDSTRKLSNQMVRVDNSNNATLTNNNITDTSDTQTEVGVQLGSGAGADSVHTFENNELDTKRGIYVSDTTEVLDNTFDISTDASDEGYAVATSDSSSSDPSGTVIENNVMTNQGGEVRAGIAVQGVPSDGTIDTDSNEIEGFEAGILFDEGASSQNIGVVNITNDVITNSSDEGISIPSATSTYGSDTEITIDGVTISDEESSTSTGILVNADGSDDIVSVDITNTDIQGPQTDTGVVVDVSNNYDVNITDSQFVNATTGLQVNNYAVDPANGDFNVHFNTFEQNDDGVVTATDPTNTDQVLNVTFNDFVDNANSGLDASNGLSNGEINANYSWWDHPNYSRIVGPYTPQSAESQPPIPRRVYSYTRLHTEGHP